MKLFTCLSPSHAPLYDNHFLPSVPLSGLEMQPPCTLPEHTESEFGTPGFRAACVHKIAYLIHVLNAETEPFVFSDVDVRFYGSVVDLFERVDGGPGNYDMGFQWDGRGGFCTGFMCIAPNERTRKFWARVAARMRLCNEMDQDAVNALLPSCATFDVPGLRWHAYGRELWTYGRTLEKGDPLWAPGVGLSLPGNLLVHHANWTVGVPNKMALLQAVFNMRNSVLIVPEVDYSHTPPEDAEPWVVSMHEEDGKRAFGPFGACLVPASVQRLHHSEAILRSSIIEQQMSLPLALVLQVWQGDAGRAIELLHLLADIELAPVQGDVLVVSYQEGMDQACRRGLSKAITYAARKFPVSTFESRVDTGKTYPGVAFDPWASTVSNLYHQRIEGARLANAFFFEPDGCPLRRDWRAWVRKAHQETLQHGRSVTGARMREQDHINGSLVMHLDMWANCPSLHRCPPDAPWDIYHGHTLVSASHPSNVIRNEFDLNVTREMFLQYRRESAWLTGIKDGSHHQLARRLLCG